MASQLILMEAFSLPGQTDGIWRAQSRHVSPPWGLCRLSESVLSPFLWQQTAATTVSHARDVVRQDGHSVTSVIGSERVGETVTGLELLPF